MQEDGPEVSLDEQGRPEDLEVRAGLKSKAQKLLRLSQTAVAEDVITRQSAGFDGISVQSAKNRLMVVENAATPPEAKAPSTEKHRRLITKSWTHLLAAHLAKSFGLESATVWDWLDDISRKEQKK